MAKKSKSKPKETKRERDVRLGLRSKPTKGPRKTLGVRKTSRPIKRRKK